MSAMEEFVGKFLSIVHNYNYLSLLPQVWLRFNFHVFVFRQAWQALGDMSKETAMEEFVKMFGNSCPLSITPGLAKI